MLEFPEAEARLAALAVPSRTERVALAIGAGSQSLVGRVLAADVAIDRDQPDFDRATMDGYALAPEPGTASYRVRGTVAAGARFDGELRPGEAVRIMTGAPVPRGATVAPIERTEPSADGASVAVPDEADRRPRRNIAFRGEDGRAGDVVLAAGTRLAPVHLAAAAMAGAEHLEVYRPPRCGVVTTGDEVGGAGSAAIRDSNGPFLAALLDALGVPARRAHARDEAGALERALEAALGESELVVTTGGVSMGDRDLVPGAVARLGFEVVFHKVAMQPGKPVLLAKRADGKLFLGLPGNPVSVLATAHLFLVPALALFMGGGAALGSRWLELPLAAPFRHAGPRRLFLPAAFDRGGVRPIAWNGSGDLYAASAGDGLVDLPGGSSLAAGALVRFLPYLGHQLGARGVLPPRASRSEER